MPGSLVSTSLFDVLLSIFLLILIYELLLEPHTSLLIAIGVGQSAIDMELARFPKTRILFPFIMPVMHSEATRFVSCELTRMKILIVPNNTSAEIHLIRKVALLNGETLFDKLDAFAQRTLLLIEAYLTIIKKFCIINNLGLG